MPLKNSLGALKTLEGSFFSTTIGNGWISISAGNVGLGYKGSGGGGTGTGIGIDPGGNVFIPTVPTSNSNEGNIYKIDANTGNILYRHYTSRGPAVTASNSNVFYSATFSGIVSGVPTYNYHCINGENLNISGNGTYKQLTGNLTNAFNFPDQYGIRKFNNNFVSLNVYGATDIGRTYVVDANNNQIGNGSVSTVSSIIRPDDWYINSSNTHVCVVGFARPTASPSTINYGISCSNISNNVATVLWKKQIGNTSFNTSLYYFTAIDDNYVYLSTNVGIAKLDIATGNIIQQKGAAIRHMLTVDNTGNVYAFGNQQLIKFDSNLDIIWYNKWQVINIPVAPGTGLIGITHQGNNIICSQTLNGLLITLKVPDDGTIPGNGVYKLGPYNFLYYSNTFTQPSNTFLTFTTSNAVPGINWNINQNNSPTGYSYDVNADTGSYYQTI